jgi:putative hydrolase of the HAD superfamily
VSGEESGAKAPSASVRAVIFDLFHTLIDVNNAPGSSTSQILGIDPIEWNRRLAEEARHHALGEERDPLESIRRIVNSMGRSVDEDQLRAAVRCRPNRFRHALRNVRADILEGLRELRAMGLRLGVLSNAGLDEVDAWDDSPLAPLIDCPLFSCHEGLMKPDPAFYLRAARRLGVSPARVIFAGDGGSSEHAGARRAGMITVLMLGLLEESLPELAAQRERNTDYTARSMAELVAIVRNLAAPAAG